MMTYLFYPRCGESSDPFPRFLVVSQAQRSTFGVDMSMTVHNKPVSPLWNWTRTPSVPVEARALLPSTSYNKITLGAGVQFIVFVNTVPIDENRAVNRFSFIRNIAGAAAA